jgi:hypothetical protein
MPVFSQFSYIISIGLFAGALYYKMYPPKFRSLYHGVRFPFAFKNEDTWREANNYVSGPMIIGSIGFAVAATISIVFPVYKTLTVQTLTSLVMLFVALTYVFTMKHMGRLFDENGNRR